MLREIEKGKVSIRTMQGLVWEEHDVELLGGRVELLDPPPFHLGTSESSRTPRESADQDAAFVMTATRMTMSLPTAKAPPSHARCKDVTLVGLKLLFTLKTVRNPKPERRNLLPRPCCRGSVRKPRNPKLYEIV